MANKTVEHLNARETIARMREEISGLQIMNEHLRFVVGRCTFNDEVAPTCGRCQSIMDGGGEFAFCRACFRTYKRKIVWQPVRIIPAEED